MKRELIFKVIFFDTMKVGGKEVISFFNDTDEKDDETVRLMSEDQAIKWLFQINPFRQLFIKSFFKDFSNVRVFFGLQEPFTRKNNKPGDIDLLLVNSNRPDKSIAFECKRIKASSDDKGSSKVNNTGSIKHGVIQANKYQSLGFHQSYLLIILIDDARQHKAKNVLFRSTSSEQLKHLYDIPWNEPLHKDVGIIFIRIIQSTGKHIDLKGEIGLCIDKPAQPLEQTVTMTNKIKELTRKF